MSDGFENFNKRPDEKFQTCQFRSKNKEPYPHQTCCATVMRHDFRCNLLAIHPLTPDHCLPCQKYVKEEPPKEPQKE